MKFVFTYVTSLLAISLFSYSSFSQGVAISSNKSEPHSSAMLDITANNKGLLIPRVSLQSRVDGNTIKNPSFSLLVYNTNANMQNGQGKGFYYNNPFLFVPNWTKLLDKGDIPQAWLVGGNSDIVDGTDYLGTSNDKDIVVKRNNIESFRIRNGGSALFTGDDGTGGIPAINAGTRMMYMPALQGAFRTGKVTGAQWNTVGVGSFATGYNVIASKIYSFAAGSSTTASADYAFASGNGTTAKGISAFSAGAGTTAEGINSCAFNGSTLALGSNSAAFNYENKAEGVNSFVIGHSNRAVGENGFSQGEFNFATAKNSAVFGTRNHALFRHSLVIGLWNDLLPIHPPGQASDFTDRIFEIGGGYDDAHRTNAMSVLRNGATSIGSADPMAMLDITKTQTNNNNKLIRLKDYNESAYCEIDINNQTTDLGKIGYFDFFNAYPLASYRFFSTIGNFNKVLMEIDRFGNTTIAGDLTQNSDIRLKENFSNLKNVLGKINNIQPVYYNFKEQSDKDRHIGFSAQEVQKQFPELVKQNEKGFLSVSYANMSAVLLQAIKEQQQQIEELKKEKQDQKEISNKLLQRLEKIEAALKK